MSITGFISIMKSLLSLVIKFIKKTYFDNIKETIGILDNLVLLEDKIDKLMPVDIIKTKDDVIQILINFGNIEAFTSKEKDLISNLEISIMKLKGFARIYAINSLVNARSIYEKRERGYYFHIEKRFN